MDRAQASQVESRRRLTPRARPSQAAQPAVVVIADEAPTEVETPPHNIMVRSGTTREPILLATAIQELRELQNAQPLQQGRAHISWDSTAEELNTAVELELAPKRLRLRASAMSSSNSSGSYSPAAVLHMRKLIEAQARALAAEASQQDERDTAASAEAISRLDADIAGIELRQTAAADAQRAESRRQHYQALAVRAEVEGAAEQLRHLQQLQEHRQESAAEALRAGARQRANQVQFWDAEVMVASQQLRQLQQREQQQQEGGASSSDHIGSAATPPVCGWGEEHITPRAAQELREFRRKVALQQEQQQPCQSQVPAAPTAAAVAAATAWEAECARRRQHQLHQQQELRDLQAQELEAMATSHSMLRAAAAVATARAERDRSK